MSESLEKEIKELLEHYELSSLQEIEGDYSELSEEIGRKYPFSRDLAIYFLKNKIVSFDDLYYNQNLSDKAISDLEVVYLEKQMDRKIAETLAIKEELEKRKECKQGWVDGLFVTLGSRWRNRKTPSLVVELFAANVNENKVSIRICGLEATITTQKLLEEWEFLGEPTK